MSSSHPLERDAEIRRLNAELEAFSHAISHDLRAPLRSIDGFSRALLEDHGDQLDPEGRDYLRRVRANVQRMGDLIDGLTELARVSPGELRRARINLSELASTIGAELRALAPERAVELIIQPDLYALADRRLIAAALTNLIENAWKFTAGRPDAQIRFGRERSGADDVFVVRDNGPGFDPAHADRLFAPFQRLHPPDQFAGDGIGLATVRRVIHRHGGAIWAESRPGAGAAFFFTIPGGEGR